MTAPTPTETAPATAPTTTSAAGGDGGQGQVPATDPPGTAPAAPPDPAPTTPPQGGDAAPREVAPPSGAPPAPPAAGNGKPPAEWSLDDFPEPIRDYVRGLRQEAGDNRVRAKTAEERAAEQFEQQRQKWVGDLLQSLGLIGEAPPDGEGGTPVPPEQQIEQLTAKLGQRDQDHRAAQVELSIWKHAAAHDAHPQRLTDSRAFIKSIEGLDPGSADFDAKIADAIKAAVDRDSYFKATQQAGQVPPPPPPVPHNGEFAGAPAGAGDDTPRSVDAFRKVLTERKRADGNY